jgi:hypothetical protein
MKQKDLTLIIVVAIVSGVFALVISNFLITSPKNRQEKVQIVSPISADFPKADERYFNANSINPTQTVKIGDNNNTKPFN